MKVNCNITQLNSDYNSGFFNIEDFKGIAIGVWGIPDEIYLFQEQNEYRSSFIVSTDNIEGFINCHTNEKFLETYKLIGSLRDIGSKLENR